MTKNLTIPPKLEYAIQKDNLVIFVGAGCSIPLGFPSWKKLVEEILQELDNKYGKISDTNFKNILNGVKTDSKSLFEALNKIENDADNGNTFKTKSQELINSKIENICKNLPKKSKTHELLWEISNKIITTNYDKALEKYIPKHLSPTVFYNTNAFQGLKSQSDNSQFLYKIHGDYEDPKTIILFESDYKDIYKDDNHNSDTLATHFKEKTLLFIGFSLTDPFVNDLFTKIKDVYKGHTINEHFAFTTKNEDFIKYDVTPVQIDNWNESLLEYLLELRKFKSNIEQTINKLTIVDSKSTDKELTKDDVNNIVELITKKTNELVSNPSDKELAKEVKDLRAKLNELLYEKVDYLQKVDKPFKNNDLQILFDTIYSSEKLDPQTLDQIQKIRNNTDVYKWYDRSVILSAITCSIIHFNKADEQKINLLIDFINDNEEKVWQKSITSLFMVLNHLGNKWLRFNSIKTKIKSLNDNSRIQNACSTIIKLFSVGLNNISMVNEELFTNPYFSDSPFNYFLPYHQEENPAFDLVYETYEGDVEKFIIFLNEVPIPDQLKYLFCSKTSSNKHENIEEEHDKDILEILKRVLNYNSLFYPYSIYVQEIISFYHYFPKFKHEEKLKSQLKLTETPLKDYLLNEKQKFTALGSHFMQEKNWSQAIVNYKDAIKIDESDIVNLLNLANCYHNNKEKDNEFSTRIKIKNKDAKNENNLTELFILYYDEKKDYNICLEIADQLISINNKTDVYYNYRGISNNKLKMTQKAIDDYSKAILINSKIKNYYYNRSEALHTKKEFAKAINDLSMAIELEKESVELVDLVLNRAINYLALSSFDDALADLKFADSFNKNKEEVYNVYSNYYRLTSDFDKAFECINNAEKTRKQFNFTGTKATIYASMGDNENFYKFLEEAFIDGAEASSLYADIKDKFKNEPQFIALLQKYDQKI